jgi:phosphate transport system protein
MADLAIDMMYDAITAYESDDLTMIKDFSTRDDTVDALRHSIFREGITCMMEDPKNIPRCTHSIMVTRYLEGCADHTCKIAENVHLWRLGTHRDQVRIDAREKRRRTFRIVKACVLFHG